jgi:hypothetical protein
MGGPVVQTGPYDTAEYVLNLARVRANDAIQSLAGNLLSDSQPFTITMLNAAYRHLQRVMVEKGAETFIDEWYFNQIPPAFYITDPGLQVYISWTGFYDGVEMHDNPVLPADMLAPLRLEERPSAPDNSPNNSASYTPMARTSDGLPSRCPTVKLCQWEWKSDKIYMIGSTAYNDVRLRYIKRLPDLLDSTDLVLVVNCSDALAYYTVMEFARPRGSALADKYEMLGDAEIDKMLAPNVKARQRMNLRRRPYSGRNGSNNGYSSF